MGPQRGIIPRAIEDVFGFIERDTGERCKFLVRASYLQIYNEVGKAVQGGCISCSNTAGSPPGACSLQVISDLLKPENQNLVVREDRKRGVHVEGLSEWVVRNPNEASDANTSGTDALHYLQLNAHNFCRFTH